MLFCPSDQPTPPPHHHHSHPWVHIPEPRTQNRAGSRGRHGARRMRSGKTTGCCVPSKPEQTLKPGGGEMEVAFRAPGRERSLRREQHAKRHPNTPPSGLLPVTRLTDATLETGHVLSSPTGRFDFLNVWHFKIQLARQLLPIRPRPWPPATHHFPVPPHSLRSLGCWSFQLGL